MYRSPARTHHGQTTTRGLPRAPVRRAPRAVPTNDAMVRPVRASPRESVRRRILARRRWTCVAHREERSVRHADRAAARRRVRRTRARIAGEASSTSRRQSAPSRDGCQAILRRRFRGPPGEVRRAEPPTRCRKSGSDPIQPPVDTRGLGSLHAEPTPLHGSRY